MAVHSRIALGRPAQLRHFARTILKNSDAFNSPVPFQNQHTAVTGFQINLLWTTYPSRFWRSSFLKPPGAKLRSSQWAHRLRVKERHAGGVPIKQHGGPPRK